jgi:hypothetical protein
VTSKTRTLDISQTWNHHPARESEAACLELQKEEQGVRVRICAPFHGDPPPPGQPGSTPRLWEYEVVEVMFADAGTTYFELELSPHGHWLALSLKGVRNVAESGHHIRCSAQIEGDRWSGEAWIPNALLPDGWCRVNAFAIHGSGDNRRYLAHSPAGGGTPDFHVLVSFVPG